MPVRDNLSVLLVEGNPADAAMYREMLVDGSGGAFRVRYVKEMARALERIEADHFDIVLLTLNLPDCRGLETFARVHEAASGIPLIVLSTEEDEQLGLRTVRLGAEDCLLKSQITQDSLVHLVRNTMGRWIRQQTRSLARDPAGTPGRVLAFWGAKGGVGTSTVAANTAAALSNQGKRTVVAELRAYHGSLARYLGSKRVHGDIASLLRTPPEQVAADQVKARLTRYSPTLALLAAPQQVDSYLPVSAPLARRIVAALASLADYVILDLPTEPGEAVREALRLSNYAGIVVDREMACVEAARASALFLRRWGLDVPAGLVVVHRSPLACPLGIETLTEATGLVVSELIPPAADACVAASRKGVPVVQAYDDALIGTSLKALATNLAANPIVTKKPA